ncbi:hypothetical protein Naga_100038g45 [Nannochloropsis gaditana]|uniref:Uncharacterized protein n=1 Tax=Nannochloropsis gaditana TaxID=72520 RepID=W7TUQ4_9STRA|nr:hypothetical protein Naga_100038g45 [Nannochloropsis gaditana]
MFIENYTPGQLLFVPKRPAGFLRDFEQLIKYFKYNIHAIDLSCAFDSLELLTTCEYLDLVIVFSAKERTIQHRKDVH